MPGMLLHSGIVRHIVALKAVLHRRLEPGQARQHLTLLDAHVADVNQRLRQECGAAVVQFHDLVPRSGGIGEVACRGSGSHEIAACMTDALGDGGLVAGFPPEAVVVAQLLGLGRRIAQEVHAIERALRRPFVRPRVAATEFLCQHRGDAPGNVDPPLAIAALRLGQLAIDLRESDEQAAVVAPPAPSGPCRAIRSTHSATSRGSSASLRVAGSMQITMLVISLSAV